MITNLRLQIALWLNFLRINFAIFLFASCTKNLSPHKADIIIYGGTSAAIIAGVQAIKSGKTVIIVSPDKHIGGLSSSGLGFTDTGDKETIGGLARDFYHRVWQHYNSDTAWKWQKKYEYGNRGQGVPAIDGENRTMWIFEPHVAEKIFEQYLAEFKIPIFKSELLNRISGVRKKKASIRSIETLSGKKFVGKIFIDASYEGDLMAAAGVSYTLGRESCLKYGEQWNGVQANAFHHPHHFTSKIDPYKIKGNPDSGLIPFISDNPILPNCSSDEKIQAYCFRMCLTDEPNNRQPFTIPVTYKPDDYELLARVFDSGWNEWFNKFDFLPNKKTDTNNHGPFSTDFIGMNYEYPEASYESRKKIIEAHKNYQMGLLYFVSTSPRVPYSIRERMRHWGLAKDEFADNGNWPYQLYIRESRRMIGEYVTTEHDILGKRKIYNSIGMGSYTMDSHNVQRYVTNDGFVQNEGDVGVHPSKPYQISYGSIVPKKSDCTNLLVPVCVSSTHIAYGSIRMEPVFMILAESAASAASLAIDLKLDLQSVPYSVLKEELISQKQVLYIQ